MATLVSRLRLTLCICVGVLSGCTMAENHTLRVGIVGDFSGRNENLARVVGLNWSTAYVNQLGGIPFAGNTFFLFEVIEYDTQSNYSRVPQLVEAAANGLDEFGNSVGDVHMVVGATGPGGVQIIAACQTWKMPNIHVAGGAPSRWRAQDTYSFAMVLPNTEYARGVFRLARVRGLSQVSIIRSIERPGSLYYVSSLAAIAWALENDFTIIGPSVDWCTEQGNVNTECRVLTQFTSGNESFNKCICGKQEDVIALGLPYIIEEVSTFYDIDERKLGDGLIDTRTDNATTDYLRAIFRDMYAQGGPLRALLNHCREIHNVNYALWLEDMSPELLFSDKLGNEEWAQDDDGILGPIHHLWGVDMGQWHPALRFRDPVFGTNQNAVQMFVSDTSITPRSAHGPGIAIPVVLSVAFRDFISATYPMMTVQEKRDELVQAIGQVSEETIFGFIRFNRNGQNVGRTPAAWQIFPVYKDGELDLKFEERCILPPEAAEAELQLPAPTWPSRFGCPPGHFNTGVRCEPCSEGTYSPEKTPGLQATQCASCDSPLGTLPGVVGSQNCSLCPAGRSTEREFPVGVCMPCPAGFAFNPSLHNDSKCHQCEPGHHATSAEGATDCSPCKPGTFMRNFGATACVDCPSGFFREEEGRTDCRQCPPATFQSETGRANCTQCDALIPHSTTASPASIEPTQCICAVGTFLRVDEEGGSEWNSTDRLEQVLSGSCAPCPGGLVCSAGRHRPVQAAGFHGSKPVYPSGLPSFVVACRNSRICPEGRELGSCPEHRAGLACDTCEDGYYETGSTCKPCQGAVWLPSVLILLAIGLFLLGMWLYGVLAPKSAVASDLLNMVVTFSLLINTAQVLSAFNQLDISWVGLMSELDGVLQLLAFQVEFLNLQCIFHSNSVVLSYAVGLLLYVVVVAVLFAVMWIPPCLACFPTTLGRFNLKPKPIARDSMVNVQGACLLVAYLSLTVASVMPWQCWQNPDGSYSVATHRSILCWEEGEHTSLLFVSVFGILTYTVLFLVVVVHAVLQYPRCMTQPGSAHFLQRYGFLFRRFHARKYYYVLIYCVRNLLIALIPVVLASERAAQMLAMTVLLFASMNVQIRLLPWRTSAVNSVDAAFSSSLILILCGGLLLLDVGTSRSLQVVELLVFVALGSIPTVTAIVSAILIQRHVLPQRHFGIFLSHHKGGAQVLARWFKLQLASHIKDTVFLDSDHLEELSTLLYVVAKHTKNFMVILTNQYLSRLWCACEVVTAQQHKLRHVLVTCDDYITPLLGQGSDLSAMWTSAQIGEMEIMGITLEAVERAFAHFVTLTADGIFLQRKAAGITAVPLQAAAHSHTLASQTAQAHLVAAVLSRCSGLQTRLSALTSAPSQMSTQSTLTDVVVLPNFNDPEAFCSAEVLRIYLHRGSKGSKGLDISSAGATPDAVVEHIKYTKLFIALLTTSCLDETCYTGILVLADRQNTPILPIVADTRYSFPCSDSLAAAQWIFEGPLFDGLTNAEARKVLKSTFTTIAASFTEYASEEIQIAQAESIARRAQAKVGRKRKGKPGTVESQSTGQSTPFTVQQQSTGQSTPYSADDVEGGDEARHRSDADNDGNQVEPTESAENVRSNADQTPGLHSEAGSLDLIEDELEFDAASASMDGSVQADEQSYEV